MDRLIAEVFRLHSKFITRDAQLKITTYQTGPLAVQIVAPVEDEALQSELIATISTNVEHSKHLVGNRFYAKNYAENEGILECLEQLKLIKLIGDGVKSGYIMLPLYELLV